MTNEKEELPFNLTDPNPFDAVGSLMAVVATASGTVGRHTTGSKQLYEAVIRSFGLDPIEIREDTIAVFRECEDILGLPFMPEHVGVLETHQKYFFDLREVFYPIFFAADSKEAYGAFVAKWDQANWSILSLSVKSLRLLTLDYELKELLTRYLTAIRQLLVDAEQSQTATEALDLLNGTLKSMDEELWKSSWEDFAGTFGELDRLLRVESDSKPKSPFSLFYRATSGPFWRVFTSANRAMDVALFMPRAYAVLNVALALVSDLSLPSGKVEEFMSLMPQLALPNPDSAQDTTGTDAPPVSPNAGEEDAGRD